MSNTWYNPFSWGKKAPSINTNVVTDELKQSVATPYAKFLRDRIGKGLPSYTGQLNAEQSPESANAYSKFMNIDAGDWFDKSIGDPETKRFKEDLMPTITEGYAGNLRGSGRYRSEEDVALKFSEDLAAKRTASTLDITKAQIDAGMTDWQMRQQAADREYQDWYKSLPETNPVLQNTLSFLNSSTGKDVIVSSDPGKEGWFNDLIGIGQGGFGGATNAFNSAAHMFGYKGVPEGDMTLPGFGKGGVFGKFLHGGNTATVPNTSLPNTRVPLEGTTKPTSSMPSMGTPTTAGALAFSGMATAGATGGAAGALLGGGAGLTGTAGAASGATAGLEAAATAGSAGALSSLAAIASPLAIGAVIFNQIKKAGHNPVYVSPEQIVEKSGDYIKTAPNTVQAMVEMRSKGVWNEEKNFDEHKGNIDWVQEKLKTSGQGITPELDQAMAKIMKKGESWQNEKAQFKDLLVSKGFDLSGFKVSGGFSKPGNGTITDKAGNEFKVQRKRVNAITGVRTGSYEFTPGRQGNITASAREALARLT